MYHEHGDTPEQIAVGAALAGVLRCLQHADEARGVTTALLGGVSPNPRKFREAPFWALVQSGYFVTYCF